MFLLMHILASSKSRIDKSIQNNSKARSINLNLFSLNKCAFLQKIYIIISDWNMSMYTNTLTSFKFISQIALKKPVCDWKTNGRKNDLECCPERNGNSKEHQNIVTLNLLLNTEEDKAALVDVGYFVFHNLVFHFCNNNPNISQPRNHHGYDLYLAFYTWLKAQWL